MHSSIIGGCSKSLGYLYPDTEALWGWSTSGSAYCTLEWQRDAIQSSLLLLLGVCQVSGAGETRQYLMILALQILGLPGISLGLIPDTSNCTFTVYFHRRHFPCPGWDACCGVQSSGDRS